jgi:hypothetical protein
MISSSGQVIYRGLAFFDADLNSIFTSSSNFMTALEDQFVTPLHLHSEEQRADPALFLRGFLELEEPTLDQKSLRSVFDCFLEMFPRIFPLPVSEAIESTARHLPAEDHIGHGPRRCTSCHDLGIVCVIVYV